MSRLGRVIAAEARPVSEQIVYLAGVLADLNIERARVAQRYDSADVGSVARRQAVADLKLDTREACELEGRLGKLCAQL